MLKNFVIKVALPNDEGFIGRKCIDEDCDQYFRISKSFEQDKMFCPYCGTVGSSKDFLTQDQSDYISNATEVEIRNIAHQEMQNIFKKTFNKRRSRSSNLKVKYHPQRIKKESVLPTYNEKKVDSNIQCPTCQTEFQVFGIFGYCPGCKEENMLIYDANLKIIEDEIQKAQNKDRAVRHAYLDLVSTFEKQCKKIANRSEITETYNFQRLFETKKAFDKAFGINIFEKLSTSELLALRRVFQKRHLYQHSTDGTIDERYIRKIPEDRELLGYKAELNVDEFKQAVRAMRIAFEDIAGATSHTKKM